MKPKMYKIYLLLSFHNNHCRVERAFLDKEKALEVKRRLDKKSASELYSYHVITKKITDSMQHLVAKVV